MSSLRHLTQDNAFTVLNYLKSRKDYINFIGISKKFRCLLDRFKTNPISLPEAKGIFSNVEIQNLYSKKERKVGGMKQYVLWYEVNYSRYLKEIQKKNTICKHVVYTKEERIKYGNSIPNGVNKIGQKCYELCGDLLNYSIPTFITSLSEESFSNCLKLSSITIPSSIVSLPHLCFYDCPSLQTVNLPNTLTSLGDNCFQKCTQTSYIQLPTNLKHIGDSCFWECLSLTNIILPSSLSFIGDFCFSRCSKLKPITIPPIPSTPKNIFHQS